MELGLTTLLVGGLLTFASPCILPLIPIYLSVLLGGSVDEVSGGKQRFRLLFNGTMFVAGFLVVFMLLGLTASALGKFMVQHRTLFQQLGGLLVFFFGLKFLGLVKVEALDQDKRFHLNSTRRLGPLGAFLIGLTFAFGWTPCVGPILGSVLTFTAVSANNIWSGMFYLLVYGLGVGIPLLVVALFAQQGVALLRKVQRFIPKIEKATGVLLIAMSILMVTDNIGIMSFDTSDESSASISKSIVDKTRDRSTGTGGSDGMLAASQGNESASCGEESTSCGYSDGGDSSQSTVDVGALTRGPVVLKFIQPDCPACLKMVPLLQTLDQTCSGRGLRIESIDLSDPSARPLARELAVVGTPTLVFFDANGSEVARLVGAQEFPAVHQAVAVLMGEKCADFSRF